MAEQRRLQAYREALRVVAAKPGGLREGMTLSRSTDIMMVLFSSDVYQALRAGRRWSAARCTEFRRVGAGTVAALTVRVLGGLEWSHRRPQSRWSRTRPRAGGTRRREQLRDFHAAIRRTGHSVGIDLQDFVRDSELFARRTTGVPCVGSRPHGGHT